MTTNDAECQKKLSTALSGAETGQNDWTAQHTNHR